MIGVRAACRLNRILDLLMNDWRVLLPLFAFFSSASASAAITGGEPKLSESDKARIAVVAQNALEDDAISESQYRSTLYWLNTYPCSGVERATSQTVKLRLEKAIAKNENWADVKVLGFFKYQSWRIVYVSNQISDEPYLFYAQNPLNAKSLGAWAGAANIFETQDILNWAIKEIPNIPQELASCFAWHVTLNRS